MHDPEILSLIARKDIDVVSIGDLFLEIVKRFFTLDLLANACVIKYYFGLTDVF